MKKKSWFKEGAENLSSDLKPHLLKQEQKNQERKKTQIIEKETTL